MDIQIDCKSVQWFPESVSWRNHKTIVSKLQIWINMHQDLLNMQFRACTIHSQEHYENHSSLSGQLERSRNPLFFRLTKKQFEKNIQFESELTSQTCWGGGRFCFSWVQSNIPIQKAKQELFTVNTSVQEMVFPLSQQLCNQVGSRKLKDYKNHWPLIHNILPPCLPASWSLGLCLQWSAKESAYTMSRNSPRQLGHWQGKSRINGLYHGGLSQNKQVHLFWLGFWAGLVCSYSGKWAWFYWI